MTSATVQGDSSARPWLRSVSPMDTATPSRQDRQPRLLPALRAKTTHFCRGGEERQRGEQGCAWPPAQPPSWEQSPSEGTWWLCMFHGVATACWALGEGPGTLTRAAGPR